MIHGFEQQRPLHAVARGEIHMPPVARERGGEFEDVVVRQRWSCHVPMIERRRPSFNCGWHFALGSNMVSMGFRQ
jgi:hypothetical protein